MIFQKPKTTKNGGGVVLSRKHSLNKQTNKKMNPIIFKYISTIKGGNFKNQKITSYHKGHITSHQNFNQTKNMNLIIISYLQPCFNRKQSTVNFVKTILWYMHLASCNKPDWLSHANLWSQSGSEQEAISNGRQSINLPSPTQRFDNVRLGQLHIMAEDDLPISCSCKFCKSMCVCYGMWDGCEWLLQYAGPYLYGMSLKCFLLRKNVNHDHELHLLMSCQMIITLIRYNTLSLTYIQKLMFNLSWSWSVNYIVAQFFL